MGVPKLWGHCSEAATLTTYAQLSDKGFRNSRVRGLRVGVDVSIWIHANASVFNGRDEEDVGPNPELRNLYYKLARMKSAGLLVLLVFDGPNTPPYKRHQRAGRSHGLTQEELEWSELAQAMGAEVLQASGEAEAELARLAMNGVIDAVMTDDVDALVFGAPLVRSISHGLLPPSTHFRSALAVLQIIRNTSKDLLGSKVNFKNAPIDSDDATIPKRSSETAVFTFSSDDILAKCAIDRSTMILVALLSGGDYRPEGIRSLGDITAVALGQLGHGQKLLDGMKAFEGQPAWQETFLVQWRAKVADELRTNENKQLSKRHPKVANAMSQEGFEYPTCEVIESYTHPNVTPISRIHLTWQKKIDVPFLVPYASAVWEWSHLRIESKFRNTLWKAILFEEIRSRALLYDGMVPRGIRDGPSGSPQQQRLTTTMAVTKHSSPPFIGKSSAPSSSQVQHLNAFVKGIHEEKWADSTENIDSYRVELDPDGFLPELLAYLPFPDPFPDDERSPTPQDPPQPSPYAPLANDAYPNASQKKGRQPPAEPTTSSFRHWVGKRFLSFGAQSFIDDFESNETRKRLTKEEEERRKAERAVARALKLASPEKKTKGKGRAKSSPAKTKSFDKGITKPSKSKSKSKQGSGAKLLSDTESSGDEIEEPAKPVKRVSPISPPAPKLDKGKGKATTSSQSKKILGRKPSLDASDSDKPQRPSQPMKRYTYIDAKSFLDSSDESESDKSSSSFNAQRSFQASKAGPSTSLKSTAPAGSSDKHVSKSPKIRRTQASRTNTVSNIIELTSSDEEGPVRKSKQGSSRGVVGVVKKAVAVEMIDLCSD